MAKIKLTKNELKKQKDALKMYTRYLPTLILKKQQLQMEIRKVEENTHHQVRISSLTSAEPCGACGFTIVIRDVSAGHRSRACGV